MNDQTAQDPQVPKNSYVDEYTPPTDSPSSEPSLDSDPLVVKNLSNDADLVDVPLNDSMNTSLSSSSLNADPQDDFDSLDNENKSLNDNVNIDPIVVGEDESDEPKITSSDEDIETQNIFMMLGVEAGDDDLKEKFLDQLQEVIWDDFLGNDVELLLSEEEVIEFKTFKDRVDSTKGDEQEEAKDKMVEFLEKLIPDLEDIMLEKALDLKADLFTERINGMKEYYAQKPDLLELVNKAELMMFEDKWKSAALLLNSIKE